MQSRIVGCLLLLMFMAGCGKKLDQQLRESVRNLDNARLEKDDVEILDVQQTGGQAIAEVKVRLALKLTQSGDVWHLDEIRLGDRRWEKAETILNAVNQQRSQTTADQLVRLREAIESYRLERGKIPTAQDFNQLIDQLSPNYLKEVIRFDSWFQSFSFLRISDLEYDLRSAGADGEFQTSDDLRAGGQPR